MERYLVIFLAFLLPACGLDGGVPSSNDTSPGGTVIYTGSIGVNSVGASGSIKIHNVNGQIVLRLEGLVTPTDTRYFVFLESDISQTAYVTQLKAPLGNQNYYTGITHAAQNWVQVTFRGLNNITFPILASAQLDP